MLKLGVVGANGQVGAELCLLLAARSDIDLIAICRNRSGSAFLRWQGIACRHGRVADPFDAERLLADCDVVVNSSLASGTPAQIRRIEDQIVRGIFRHSKASATVIHFSTQSVYGDPQPNRWIRSRNPYGRAKLATERQVRIESRRMKKPCYILRLGHVCGALQEISHTIRASIRAGSVALPSQNPSSNTVYTAAIIGAIDQIIAGKAQPDTYDLMNTPRWNWREVYEYEASVCQMPLAAEWIESPPVSKKLAVISYLARLASSAAASGPAREMLVKLFTYMPDSINARAMAWSYARRARSEISALGATSELPEYLLWIENGANFFPAEIPTIELLHSASSRYQVASGLNSWPADLPDAGQAIRSRL